MSETETSDTHAPTRESRRKHTFNLDNMSVPELTALRDAAEAKRQEKLEEAKNAVLEETRARLAELGLSLDAVLPAATGAGSPTQGTGTGRKKRSDAGQPLTPKYRGPNGETWSGRGREPRWLQALTAEGRNKEEFRVT